MSAIDDIDRFFKRVKKDLPEGAQAAIVVNNGESLQVVSNLDKELLGLFCVDFLQREGLAKIIIRDGEEIIPQ